MKINLSGLVLLTGVPGSGKTLRMMEYLEAALKAGRPCFACNIDGLNMPGVIPFDDPQKWQELPPQAVLFVDEAQGYFRTRSGLVPLPPYIEAMETIRHDGVCIVMTTQQPTYLDKHLRGLVGHHEHLIEVVAGKASNVYTFRRCREDLTDTVLAAAQFEVWAHPKRLHGAYKSAEVHTKKARIPRKFVILGGLLAVYLIAVGWRFLGPEEAHATEGRASGALAPPPAQPTAQGSPENVPMDALSYAARFVPRFPNQPKSAPAWDDLPVASRPQVVCMIAGAGLRADGTTSAVSSCRCMTEQATRYTMPDDLCRTMAEQGASYDPFKPPASEVIAGSDSAPIVEAEAPLAAVATDAQQVAGYGAFRP